MRLSVTDFFKSHNITLKKDGYVMCVDDGYSPQFDKGKFYKVANKIIRSGYSFNISSVDDQVFHKLFIPLQGEPDKLTLRDKLLIQIRTNVSASIL